MALSHSLLRLASSRFTKPHHLFSFAFSFSTISTQKPPPIQVSLTDTVGRAVFATRPIPAGDLIHTAEPAVCHPSPSAPHPVCYSCLARLPNLSSPFCSHRCRTHTQVRAFVFSSLFNTLLIMLSQSLLRNNKTCILLFRYVLILIYL